jgi:uncharacterized protein
MSKVLYIDANVVLRFLRNDDPKQSPASARLIEAAKEGKLRLLISAVTCSEIFYVLNRAYKIPRKDTAAILIPFFQSEVIEVENRALVLDALLRLGKANVDFGDAYLAACAVHKGAAVASFDHDLLCFKDLKSMFPL